MKMPGSLIAFAALVATCVDALGQSRTEIYDLQERCGKRAAEFFGKVFHPEDRKGLEVYESHYNIRLNRCFLLWDNTTYTRIHEKTHKTREMMLVDVNANKTYGEFRSSGSSMHCKVLEKDCRSEQEFLTLTKPYMED